VKFKTGTILLLAFLSCARADDVRIVNGAPVDLGPVHEWSARKKGERPLKHWKEVRVLDIKPVGGISHYSVEIEGRMTEVMLEHLPERITRHFEQTNKLKQQADDLRDYVQKESLRIRDMSATAKATAAKSGHRKASPTAKADVALAKSALAEKKTDLSNLTKQLAALKKEEGDMVEYAMFTGKKYAGLDIWDCGRK
jgi:hypothetical protein